MRALECSAKKAEVQKLMHQFSKEDNDEIGHEEFMQISMLLKIFVLKLAEIIICKSMNYIIYYLRIIVISLYMASSKLCN